MVIDEVQLAPELLRAIKVLVDLDSRPGRFLLTGLRGSLRCGAFPTRCRGTQPGSTNRAAPPGRSWRISLSWSWRGS